MIYTRFCSLLIVCLTSCGGMSVLPIDTPETCQSACDNLKKMSCEGWQPECVEMCTTMSSEPGVSFHTKCVSKAQTCQAADTCLTF